MHSMETGEPSRTFLSGIDGFEHLRRDPEPALSLLDSLDVELGRLVRLRAQRTRSARIRMSRFPLRVERSRTASNSLVCSRVSQFPSRIPFWLALGPSVRLPDASDPLGPRRTLDCHPLSLADACDHPFAPSASVLAYRPLNRVHFRNITQSPVQSRRHSASPHSRTAKTNGRSGDRCGGSAFLHACSSRNRRTPIKK
jgi:hypothetical protein